MTLEMKYAQSAGNAWKKLRESSRIYRGVFVLAGVLYVCGAANGQTSVTTQHNDIARTGANSSETILTPTNINSTTFGRLFSQTVDGYIYTQPLYLPGVTMGAGTSQAGTTHNVVFVATEHDSVYAFDADSNGGANGLPLWKITLLDAAHGAAAGATSVPNGDVGSGDIVPEVGITGTPVIDASTNTLYVVGKTKENNLYFQRLHALDVTTGQEKFGGPVTITASIAGNGTGSSGGVLNFDPKWENQRPALLLVNGIVYIGFAAHGDNGPWHGWVLAYNAANLQKTGVWCTSPNSFGSGVWMSGAGLAADVPSGKPYGRMFTVTGNGLFDGSAPYKNTMDYGDSVVTLDLSNGVPTVVDDFTPHDQASLNGSDQDQASGGVMLLPDSVGGGGGNHQLVQLGKSGRVYVLNRENLGGYNPNNTTDPGEKAHTGGLWGAPAYWNGQVYIWGQNDSLKAFSYANGTITSSTAASKSAETVGTYSPTPSISANGNTNGIVWSLRTDNFGSTPPGRAILYAHDASNVSKLLYTSDQNAQGTDVPGQSVKFATPTIANGKVYVGTKTQVSIFGLLGATQQAALPIINPVGQALTAPTQITITDSTPGASIFYTIDGSTPTTASTPYTGPITVSSTETISAIASAPGFLQSQVARQSYTVQTQTLSPTFNPPPTNYQSAQSVTISDATPGSTIYYTVDGTTPSPGVGTTKIYSAPLLISNTTTIQAMATSSGMTASPVASALYTISSGGTTIDFSAGFSTAPTTMTLNGSTGLDDTRLQLTSGLVNQAGSAFNNIPVNVQAFTTDFTFQLSNAGADGITFTLQGTGLTSLGTSGGGLGYGPIAPGGTPGIGKSVAIKFDTYGNQTEGPNSTGLYTNGASPTIPAIDLTPSGIDLHSGSTISVHMVYDGTTLSMTMNDPVSGKSFSNSWQINIPAMVGGPTAYAGFTGGTGGQTSSQKIGSWTFFSTAGQAAAAPTFNPSTGTYLGTQILTISDTTSGATIYYTTDGSTPTTSSTQYTGPLAITSTQTIKAVATAAGYSVSPVGSATLSIESQAAAPSFSPGGGTYSGPQAVTITSSSPGAVIYYTTDGSKPSTSSTQYSGPITVSSTETVQAIAVASGFFASNVSSASYTIGSGVTAINLGSGFTAGAMVLNGKAALNGTRLRLTDGSVNEASSAWFNAPVGVSQFSTSFNFQTTGGTSQQADGFAFVIQNNATTAIGPFGGGLGYGPDKPGGTPGIGKSIAVKFDLYNNNGEGANSTGLYLNGVSPTTPAIDLTSSGINLHSTDVFNAQLVYDGTNLTLTLTDTVTSAKFTQVWPINIVSTIGGSSAFAGFTGGTGGSTAIQEIIGWTMSSNLGVTATPRFSPAGGSYPTTQSVTISDATPGAVIYYTTNNTTPTTASPVYSGAISVSASETIQAIAVAPGFSASGVASATYAIVPPAATPLLSLVAGTYTSVQSLTITDSTPGAVIYYTTNGTIPTTASTVYSGAISVNTSETIQAIATAPGFSASAVASAAYIINLPAAATPLISPATGTYSSAQTVTITDTTPGAAIYYTTDGSQPTATSTLYAGSFSVSSTTTVKAIAIASGFSASSVATSVISIPNGGIVNYAAGFTRGGVTLNGNAILNGTRLRLTDTGTNEAGSGWYTTPVNIQTFSSDFTFQLTSPIGNGIAFVLQNAGTSALGPSGGGLGYGPDNVSSPSSSPNTPIGKSVAIKFDLRNNTGEGPNSTGIYRNGASPTVPAVTLGGGVDLHSGDILKAHLNYDGKTLTLTLTDTVTPTKTFTTAWTVDIPGTVGANTAYIGFTGATGSSTSIQEIVTWTYDNTFTTPKTPVRYSTTALPAVSSGPTFRTFTYAGFPDTTGTILDATSTGDSVAFTVNVATICTCDVAASYKMHNSRGISQLSINEVNIGAPMDQYAVADAYGILDFGTFTFPAAGNYTFKFSVTGKNTSSSGYNLTFDELLLTPQ